VLALLQQTVWTTTQTRIKSTPHHYPPPIIATTIARLYLNLHTFAGLGLDAMAAADGSGAGNMPLPPQGGDLVPAAANIVPGQTACGAAVAEDGAEEAVAPFWRDAGIKMLADREEHTAVALQELTRMLTERAALEAKVNTTAAQLLPTNCSQLTGQQFYCAAACPWDSSLICLPASLLMSFSRACWLRGEGDWWCVPSSSQAPCTLALLAVREGATCIWSPLGRTNAQLGYWRINPRDRSSRIGYGGTWARNSPRVSLHLRHASNC